MRGIGCGTLTSMVGSTAKVYENRLRRMAKRQGLELRKSKRKDPRALDFGRWAIFTEGGAPVVGLERDRFTLDLADVERHLTGNEENG